MHCIGKTKDLFTTLNIDSNKHTDKVNVIINCDVNMVNSNIIAIPIDFDGTIQILLPYQQISMVQLYHDLEMYKLTVIYF